MKLTKKGYHLYKISEELREMVELFHSVDYDDEDLPHAVKKKMLKEYIKSEDHLEEVLMVYREMLAVEEMNRAEVRRIQKQAQNCAKYADLAREIVFEFTNGSPFRSHVANVLFRKRIDFDPNKVDLSQLPDECIKTEHSIRKKEVLKRQQELKDRVEFYEDLQMTIR